MNENIIEREVRNQGIANEFFELKEAIDGIDYDTLCADWCVLADTLEEETDDCWVEIDAGSDCKFISMVYVDFDSDWKNAKVSYENVTVYKENIAEGCEQVNIKTLKGVKRTKQDYEEWIGTMLNMYHSTDRLVDAVWNQFYADAERDGYADFLEDNEEDVCDTIRVMISEATY